MIQKYLVFSLVLGIGMFLGVTASAQDPDHVVSITSATLQPVGASGDVFNFYDNTSAANIAGWSWGNCIGDNTIIDITAVGDGATTLTIADGSPPAFDAPAIIPGEGWTVGVVIDFFGNFPLPPGTGYELYFATYTGLAVGISDVNYCSDLGMPAVELTFVDSMGGSILPTATGGSIEVMAGPPPFKFQAPSQTVFYNPDTDDTASYEVTVAIEEDAGNPGFPNNTAGFSMGLMLDNNTTVDALDPSPLASALGDDPAFFGPALLADGWTVGVVYDFFGMVTLAFGTSIDVITASYTTAGLLGDLDGEIVNLTWVDDLGMPPVENIVVVGADASLVEFFDGVIDLQPLVDVPFIRGDCNDDGIVNIADGIFILNFNFQNGPAGNCAESCDANDDNMMGPDISDATYIFAYRFQNGPPPPAPFPDCGPVPGADCDLFNSCP